MVIHPKSISIIDEIQKILEISCPTRISLKTLRKTDEFTRSGTGTAATGVRRKPLGKQTNSKRKVAPINGILASEFV